MELIHQIRDLVLKPMERAELAGLCADGGTRGAGVTCFVFERLAKFKEGVSAAKPGQVAGLLDLRSLPGRMIMKTGLI